MTARQDRWKAEAATELPRERHFEVSPTYTKRRAVTIGLMIAVLAPLWSGPTLVEAAGRRLFRQNRSRTANYAAQSHFVSGQNEREKHSDADVTATRKEAGETEIVEIMTPRTRIKFLDVNTPVPEMFEQFKAIRHPRVPVCRGRTDNFVGFLHAEDVLRLTMDGGDLNELPPDKIMHKPVVVPPTKSVDEMFEFFQAKFECVGFGE